MKKVSFSLVAVLAIVFAVASAFSTNSKRIIEWRYYGLPNDTYSTSGAGPTVANAEAGTLFHVSSTDITIPQALTASTPNDGCQADASFYCAAEVKNNNGPKSVTELATGDFFSF